MSDTRYGRQPGHAVLHEQARTLRGSAKIIGVTERQLSAALRGVVAPSPLIRVRLSKLLGVPVDKLFTIEALAAEYSAQHAEMGQRGSQS